jgi:hypothetical protein
MPADPHALTCPCSCHGHGPDHPCDMDGGCGHLHGRPVAEYAALGSHCPGCRRPVRDGLRCVACTDRMTSDLEDVPWLVTELDLTRSRQDRIGESGARGGTHVLLGYRPMAAEVADVLGLTLAAAAAGPGSNGVGTTGGCAHRPDAASRVAAGPAGGAALGTRPRRRGALRGRGDPPRHRPAPGAGVPGSVRSLHPRPVRLPG